MTETAIAQYTTDGRLWIDRFVDTLKEIHERIEEIDEVNVNPILALIENTLYDYENTYGKNATRNFARKRDRTQG